MVADCGLFGQSRHIGRRWSMEWHGHCLCNERPSPWAIPPLGAAFVGGLLYLAMTPNDFRRLALSRPEAVEVFRKGRSDFRVRRKSFASLKGHADSAATVQLTPEQQAMFMQRRQGPLCQCREAGGGSEQPMLCSSMPRKRRLKVPLSTLGAMSLQRHS
jgi:hypothetical protein